MSPDKLNLCWLLMASKIQITVRISVDDLQNPQRLDDFHVLKVAMKHKIPIRGTKTSLCTALLKKLYNKTPSATLIWKTFIKYFLWKLGGPYTKPVNDTDYFTGSEVSLISPYYLFAVTEPSGQFHFDIRTIANVNIYTTHEFNKDSLIRYNRKLKWLKSFGFPTTIKVHARSPEQYCVDVFQLINNYQYCDSEWFEALTFYQLVNLYNKISDIWMYRANLTLVDKCRIVKDGVIFSTDISNHTIAMLKQHLLHSIERMVTEGSTDDDRKLGAVLVMLGLVQVSEPARLLHPGLHQATH
jgi:hypothetical protein